MSAAAGERLILLYPAQTEFLAREEPFVAFAGGIGSGKSFILCYDLLRRVRRGGLYMVIAPTFPMLRDATMRSFFDVAHRLGVPAALNRAEHKVTLPRSGAEVLFRSADNPETLRGPNLAGAALDEASVMGREAFDVAIGRLRQGGEFGFLRAAMTPKGRHHWTYEVFASGRPDTALVRARTADNPFLPERFAEAVARQYDADLARQELGGEFLEEVSGYLYPDAWLEHAARLAEGLRGKARRAEAAGVDPGEGSADTSLCAVDRLGVVELVSLKTPDTSVVPGEVLAFARRHHLPAERVAIDAGGGGKQHADRLRAQGFPARVVAFGEAVAPPMRRGAAPLAERLDARQGRQAFRNRRNQMYSDLRDLLDPANGGFAIPGEYAELRRQMGPIPLLRDGEGRLDLPPKSRREGQGGRRCLAELIGRSPDDLDALALAAFAMLHGQDKPRAKAR